MEEEVRHIPCYCRKDRSLLMQVIGKMTFFVVPDFMTHWWTTIGTTIYYPTSVADPDADSLAGMRAHEMIHVEQWRDHPVCMVLLYLLFPLPVLFSGRWFIERSAYLLDILAGRYSVDRAVEDIWSSYLWPWPRLLMRRWFEAKTFRRMT